MYFFKISLKILVILYIICISDINALPTLKSELKEQNLAKISWIKQMQVLRHLLKECENVGLKIVNKKYLSNGYKKILIFYSLLHRMILLLLGSV